MKEINTLQNVPARQEEDHKGKFGSVLVVAGSNGMCGAGCLASEGAQKAGAGLITLALPRRMAMVGELFRASIISKPLPETESGAISLLAVPEVDRLAKETDVCAIGPGMGREEETEESIEVWTRELAVPLVLDADALNALSERKEALKSRNAPALITPHPGEMARLAGLGNAGEVQKNRAGTAADFARDCNTVTVLKGHRSVVTDGERIYTNDTGNPGMAAGGMGDVLTGLIAAFIAQGMESFEAGCLGVFVHGLAGDRAAARLGRVSLSPEDLLETLPHIFLRLESLPGSFSPSEVTENLQNT